MEWLAPWFSAEYQSTDIHDSILRQLKHEVGPSHKMYEVPVRLIARGNGDDALFEFLDGTGRVAKVHLTWSKSQEKSPWPISKVYANLNEWSATGMVSDHKEWADGA